MSKYDVYGVGNALVDMDLSDLLDEMILEEDKTMERKTA